MLESRFKGPDQRKDEETGHSSVKLVCDTAVITFAETTVPAASKASFKASSLMPHDRFPINKLVPIKNKDKELKTICINSLTLNCLKISQGNEYEKIACKIMKDKRQIIKLK